MATKPTENISMLEHTVHFSIRHRWLVLIMVLGLMLLGVYNFNRLAIDAVPDITNVQVQINTEAAGYSPLEMEQRVTFVVETALASIPKLDYTRSLSRYGLSQVTVVFEDQIGTYIPRQLIAEKLKNAEDKIPEAFGKPFLGPISTGLGEIYQYTLEVDSLYRDTYSLSDLRTIQDWVVKRQLSGISGVVEVNTWGGAFKTI